MKRTLKWNFTRRFGIEFEFTNRQNELARLAEITKNVTGSECKVRNYEHTRDNYNTWVCKTDGSCGTELVSPILSGYAQLKKTAELLPVLQANRFNIGNQCGQHVHVEIADFTKEQVGVLCSWWIKIERFIMNGTPSHRRNNTYCSLLTQEYNISPFEEYEPNTVREEFGRGRHALNLRNWSVPDNINDTGRGTVEFRFGEMTFDPEIIKNRVRFLIWFVEMVKVLPAPKDLTWLTPRESLMFLKLLENDKSVIQYEYSPAIQSMRKWILKRFIDYAPIKFQKDIDSCKNMLESIIQAEAASAKV